MEFKNIELEDREIFDKYFSMKKYMGSECTFTNLFVWQKCYDIRWAEANGALFIKVRRKEFTFVLPPFVGKEGDLSDVLASLSSYFAGQPFEIRGIYEDMLPLLQERLPSSTEFVEDRDNWDYIYLRENLASLSGRKYHAKKNHANAFRKEHPDYEFSLLTKDDVEECIEFADAWCEKKEPGADELRCEFCALEKALRNLENLSIKGAVIRIDGKIQAFAVGEKLNPETAVIHFEKANPEIRGLYAVINQDFCAGVWTDVTYINREEDMGIEGLRKAKESYRPEFMVKKYSALISAKR
ncbi:MAG: phosphatidylglycerol lysyltransferase domain-containing protein [Acidaminococcaceae bacterium]|nr:phosphatidylglycerol lysyltransferase domain-containing protein [Acidaminococcaceae bacterium]